MFILVRFVRFGLWYPRLNSFGMARRLSTGLLNVLLSGPTHEDGRLHDNRLFLHATPGKGHANGLFSLDVPMYCICSLSIILHSAYLCSVCGRDVAKAPVPPLTPAIAYHHQTVCPPSNCCPSPILAATVAPSHTKPLQL